VPIETVLLEEEADIVLADDGRLRMVAVRARRDRHVRGIATVGAWGRRTRLVLDVRGLGRAGRAIMSQMT
jgi:hypothetical protein